MAEFEDISRINAPALDEIIGKPLKVLDDGFVRVIDYMGSDQSIVQAARVSYGKGTKKISQDRGLIRYLVRHRHTTPLEMCELKLHLRVPMDCWRQWIRHRSANVNEYSTRYSIAIDAAQMTPPDQWRMQSSVNRQGSGEFCPVEIGEELTRQERDVHDLLRKVYSERLEKGVAREQARKDLPLSTYTEAYWKIDLHNLLHFLELRMEGHAQIEIREYAGLIGNEIVKRWCPTVWEAFLDYRMNAIYFSRLEQEIIKEITEGNTEKAIKTAEENGWLEHDDEKLKINIERMELEEKLEKLGIKKPWQ